MILSFIWRLQSIFTPFVDNLYTTIRDIYSDNPDNDDAKSEFKPAMMCYPLCICDMCITASYADKKTAESPGVQRFFYCSSMPLIHT